MGRRRKPKGPSQQAGAGDHRCRVFLSHYTSIFNVPTTGSGSPLAGTRPALSSGRDISGTRRVTSMPAMAGRSTRSTCHSLPKRTRRRRVMAACTMYYAMPVQTHGDRRYCNANTTCHPVRPCHATYYWQATLIDGAHWLLAPPASRRSQNYSGPACLNCPCSSKSWGRSINIFPLSIYDCAAAWCRRQVSAALVPKRRYRTTMDSSGSSSHKLPPTLPTFLFWSTSGSNGELPVA